MTRRGTPALTSSPAKIRADAPLYRHQPVDLKNFSGVYGATVARPSQAALIIPPGAGTLSAPVPSQSGFPAAPVPRRNGETNREGFQKRANRNGTFRFD
jgi:hypothetical protein